MPQRPFKDPEFGSRAASVRKRISAALDFRTVKDYATWLGIDNNTYRPWENRSALPAAFLLARAFLNARHPRDSRPLAEAPRLVCYLATGEPYLEPIWLRDWNADPFAEPAASEPSPRGPTGAPATNIVPFEFLREKVAPALRKTAVRELQNANGGDLELVEIAAALERLVRAAQPASPGGVADASRSNLLNHHDGRAALVA